MRKISTISALCIACLMHCITIKMAGQEPGRPVSDSLSFNTSEEMPPLPAPSGFSGLLDDITPEPNIPDGSGTGFSDLPQNAVYNNIEQNLVAYYPFNGNANDQSGNNNHGTVSGPVLYADRFGKANSAYRYTAKNHVIDISNISSATLSASLWYYYEGNGNDWNTLLCRDGGTYHHLLINATSKEIGFYNNAWYSSGTPLQQNTWYHIVLIKQNNICILYLDTKRIQYSVSSFNNNTYPLSRIGNYSGLTQGSLGVLDDIRIYDRVLSDEEIEMLYHEQRVRADSPEIQSAIISHQEHHRPTGIT